MKRWPKENRGGRYQVCVTGTRLGYARDDIKLTFTRKGLEFEGYYDTFVGLPGGFLTWDEIASIRAELEART